jgi:hypothetical protein
MPSLAHFRFFLHIFFSPFVLAGVLASMISTGLSLSFVASHPPRTQAFASDGVCTENRNASQLYFGRIGL